MPILWFLMRFSFLTSPVTPVVSLFILCLVLHMQTNKSKTKICGPTAALHGHTLSLSPRWAAHHLDGLDFDDQAVSDVEVSSSQTRPLLLSEGCSLLAEDPSPFQHRAGLLWDGERWHTCPYRQPDICFDICDGARHFFQAVSIGHKPYLLTNNDVITCVRRRFQTEKYKRSGGLFSFQRHFLYVLTYSFLSRLTKSCPGSIPLLLSSWDCSL